MTARRGVIAVDRLTLLFAIFLTAVIILRIPDNPDWAWHLLAMALTGVLIALLTRSAPEHAVPRFLGPSYPLILATGYYTIIGAINEGVGRNYDLVVQGWETALFGGPVSVTWHQAWPGAVLSWALHLCYGAYYVIVLAVGIWLWRRTSRTVNEAAVFHVALAFFISYVWFALFPVAGPRYFYGTATGAAAVVWPARVVHRLLEGGSAYGTAFPSSHIAAAWSAVLASWRAGGRRVPLVLALPALGLALGTVYGQFHYAVDAVAGVALAGVVLVLAGPVRRLLTR